MKLNQAVTILDRRAFRAGVLIGVLICLSFNIGYTQVSDTVDMYYYKNSLHNHLETGNSEATPSTNVGNWIARFTAVPSNPKTATLGSVFGFFPQWSVPPRANNFHAEITTPHLQKWTASWAQAEKIDLLGFVPDNFDGQSFNPSDTTNMGEAYVTKLLYLIDQWDSSAPNPNRRYVVYAGWPALNSYGGTNDDPSTLTTAAIAKWQTYGLGDYQDWMELLVTQLQSARPNLDIRLHNINKAVLMCYQNTFVKDILPEKLFEDLAPHGRSTWYFLAAIAEYMEVFGEKPPASFQFQKDWAVDTTVTTNYQLVVDYIWSVINENASTEEPSLVHANQIKIYPNPAQQTLFVGSQELNVHVDIMNALGQTVLTTDNKNSIDVGDLKEGVYYVILQSNSFTQHHTIIIKR